MEAERLQIVINELLMSVPEFAKSISVSSDTIYNILRGKTKITPFVKANLFNTYPELSREWFEKGNGEIFRWKNNDSPLVIKDREVEYGKVCKLCIEKERYIAALEDRVEAQKKVIESQEECLKALRALGGSNKGISSG